MSFFHYLCWLRQKPLKKQDQRKKVFRKTRKKYRKTSLSISFQFDFPMQVSINKDDKKYQKFKQNFSRSFIFSLSTFHRYDLVKINLTIFCKDCDKHSGDNFYGKRNKWKILLLPLSSFFLILFMKSLTKIIKVKMWAEKTTNRA